MSRQLEQLNYQDFPEDTVMHKTLKALSIGISEIMDRATNGMATEEDIAFARARRSYLSDEQLKNITGKTFAEIEVEVAGDNEAPKSQDLSKLKKDDLIALAVSKGLEITGDETKDVLIEKLNA